VIGILTPLSDIQLNVKGMKDLEASFRNYVEVEKMEGDNKYQAEGLGLQDAQKGIIFESFPPVLHLQLKRFEYDIQRDAMVKVSIYQQFVAGMNQMKLTDLSRSMIVMNSLLRLTSSPSSTRQSRPKMKTGCTNFMVSSSTREICMAVITSLSSSPTGIQDGSSSMMTG